MNTLPPPAATGVFPFDLVRPQLEQVESALLAQAEAFDPAVRGYVSYVAGTSGKRIRPALTILAGGATGGFGADHVRLATILEMIHVASLVHDDIMDAAEIRRQMPTASARWGQALSVLLGDALFAHALDLATEFEDREITRAIARATREVCTGEILQTQRRFDLNLTRETYFEIIRLKTAALFAVACGLAAALNGEDEETQRRLHHYGERLGMAYQIYDDLLDLVGTETEVGKTLGTDLVKGKLTLPILNLLEAATPAQREKLGKRLIQAEPIDIDALAGIADYQGALEAAAQTARNLLAEARHDLRDLAPGPHREALEQIVSFVEARIRECLP